MANEDNKILAEIAKVTRKGYGDKGDEELRLELSSYKDKPYLSLRLWWVTPDGTWAPSKKGISVRLGELQWLKDALNGPVLGKALAVATKPPAAKKPVDDDEPFAGDGTSSEGVPF